MAYKGELYRKGSQKYEEGASEGISDSKLQAVERDGLRRLSKIKKKKRVLSNYKDGGVNPPPPSEPEVSTGHRSRNRTSRVVTPSVTSSGPVKPTPNSPYPPDPPLTPSPNDLPVRKRKRFMTA